MAATIDSFLNSFNTKFDAPVRSHLKNVYASLTMTVASATAGAYVHLFTDILQGGGLLFALVSMGLALGLHFTPDNGKNRGQRMAMLLGFGFLTGLGMGPLLQMAMMMNPSIVPTAFMVTATIFGMAKSKNQGSGKDQCTGQEQRLVVWQRSVQPKGGVQLISYR